MNTKTCIAIAAGLLLSAGAFPARAGETLWNLTFKDLASGKTPAEVVFTSPCSGPQRVVTDAQNTLTGAAAVGALNGTPLRFEKKTAANYTPALTLKASSPYTSGIITTKVDLIFDNITMDAQHPVETLLSIPFMNDKGGSDYVVVFVSEGGTVVNVSLSGVRKSLPVKPGEVAHLKTVLDLGKHTFQAFLNDAPLTDVLQDDQKYSTFLGLTIRDGTALGGNHGAAFVAGIANMVVSRE